MSLEPPSQALHSNCSEEWEGGEAEEQKRQQEQDPTVMGRSQVRGWGWPLVTTRGCRIWAVTTLHTGAMMELGRLEET